ncbi:MAG: hypothetical protein HC868_04545 [Sphingomonadales bacterium]|nr:hypothetical protein [Sphingomonadales bacterium]
MPGLVVDDPDGEQESAVVTDAREWSKDFLEPAAVFRQLLRPTKSR